MSRLTNRLWKGGLTKLFHAAIGVSTLLCYGTSMADTYSAPKSIHFSLRAADNNTEYISVPYGNIANGMLLNLWRQQGNSGQNWNFVANLDASGNPDGTFVIHPEGSPNLCVEHNASGGALIAPGVQSNFGRPQPGVTWYNSWGGWRLMANLANCNQSNNQKFFAQKTSTANTFYNANGVNGSEYNFLIRSVATPSDCLNAAGGSGDGAQAIWYQCQWTGSLNDRWSPILNSNSSVAGAPHGYAGPDTFALSRWADIYAVSNSVTGMPVTNIVASNAINVVQNQGGAIIPFTTFFGAPATFYNNSGVGTANLNYSYTSGTQNTFTYGFTEGIQFSIGTGKDSPVSVSFQASFSANQQWQRQQSQSSTSSASYQVPAYTSFWLAYSAESTLTGTGTFVIYNDTGDSWTTGAITASSAIIPDGSGVNICTNSSSAPVSGTACIATKPASAI